MQYMRFGGKTEAVAKKKKLNKKSCNKTQWYKNIHCFTYMYMWNNIRTCSCEIHACSAYCQRFGQMTQIDELLDFFTQRIHNSFICFISGSDALTFILAEAENVSLFIQYISPVLCRTKKITNVCSLAWVWMSTLTDVLVSCIMLHWPSALNVLNVSAF